MSLIDWRSRSIEEDVGTVMKAEGVTDLSIPSRKQWVREFIRDVIPWWTPGEELTPAEAYEIGNRFGDELIIAKRQLNGLDDDE